jgi:hypothetical protein
VLSLTFGAAVTRATTNRLYPQRGGNCILARHRHAGRTFRRRTGGRGHALLGKALQYVGLASRLVRHQGLRADGLVVAGVVTLVELVPTGELGTDGVQSSLSSVTLSIAWILRDPRTYLSR